MKVKQFINKLKYSLKERKISQLYNNLAKLKVIHSWSLLIRQNKQARKLFCSKIVKINEALRPKLIFLKKSEFFTKWKIKHCQKEIDEIKCRKFASTMIKRDLKIKSKVFKCIRFATRVAI